MQMISRPQLASRGRFEARPERPAAPSMCWARTPARAGAAAAASMAVVAAPPGTRASANANARSGSSAMHGAERQHTEPDPDPVDQRVHDHMQRRRLRPAASKPAQHDIEVVRRNRGGSPLPLSARFSCFRKNHLAGYMVPNRLPSRGNGDMRRHHLLLPVVGHAHLQMSHREAGHRRLLSRLEHQLLFLLVAFAGKAEERSARCRCGRCSRRSGGASSTAGR